MSAPHHVTPARVRLARSGSSARAGVVPQRAKCSVLPTRPLLVPELAERQGLTPRSSASGHAMLYERAGGTSATVLAVLSRRWPAWRRARARRRRWMHWRTPRAGTSATWCAASCSIAGTTTVRSAIIRACARLACGARLRRYVVAAAGTRRVNGLLTPPSDGLPLRAHRPRAPDSL